MQRQWQQQQWQRCRRAWPARSGAEQGRRQQQLQQKRRQRQQLLLPRLQTG